MARPSTSATLEGKVCLVTGSTGGIGAATAKALAARGAAVLVTGRDAGRGRAVVEEIASGGWGSAEFVPADLSSQDEVRALAVAFLARHERLDVLVNNAGALFMRRRESVDGIEMTFALNHLAPFLLTHLLMDALQAAPAPRVVTVSSGAHRRARLEWDDLQSRRHYRGLRAYGQSKLANILFTYELARRSSGTNLTANTLHPGLVASGFALNNGAVVAYSWRLLGALVAKSVDEGAKTVVYLASSPEVEGVSGQYFSECRPVASSPVSHDLADALRLWKVSEKLTAADGM